MKRSRPAIASGDRVAGSGPLGRDARSGLGGSGSGSGGVTAQRGSPPGWRAPSGKWSRVGAAVCAAVRRKASPCQPSRSPINGRVSNANGVARPFHPARHSACQDGASVAGRRVSQPQR